MGDTLMYLPFSFHSIYSKPFIMTTTTVGVFSPYAFSRTQSSSRRTGLPCPAHSILNIFLIL